MFLILSFAVTLFTLPTTRAATRTSYPFIDAVPNPVGIGQETLLNFGVLNFLIDETEGWKDLTITITKPDNTTDTLGPYDTDSTGATGRSFTPDMTGTYYLQVNFPQQDYRNETYSASTSEKLALVVTQEPVPFYPGQALPSEYWARPIDSQLREWYSLAGSWVATPLNMYQPNNAGPESSHILWTRPIGDTMGGLAGGDTEEHGYGTGDAYEGKWAGSVIISGVLYYNKYATFTAGSTSPQQAVVAVDLHTGKELWTKTLPVGNQRIAFGQVLFWNSLNYQGAFSYLWVTAGTNWFAFEPLTGDLKYNMTNVPGGTNYYGPNGEILKYSLTNIGNASNPNWRLLRWNSTQVVALNKTGTAESWGSQTQGVTYNATARGYDLNVTVPAGLPGSIQRVFVDDKVIGARVNATEVDLWAISLKKGSEGTLLFNKAVTAPSEWSSGNLTLAGWAGWSQEDNVAVFLTKENRKYYGFSTETGNYLWETDSEIYSNAWDATSGQRVRALAYGRFYSASVGGIVYCYNVTTGKLLWTYEAADSYSENLYGNNWWTVTNFITDGKIYIGNLDHSPIDPKWRAAPFICLNATNGDVIWRADGLFRQTFWGGRAIIGDSIIATQDTYDQRIYAVGKGPSAISVSAPDVAVSSGASVVLKGTVTDVSPGTKDDALTLRFPNGVPAVSDDSMNDWMLHVYKQFEKPTNITGVQVKLTAIDPNMNQIDIGTTTSDAYGNFGFSFKPQITGNYQIIATFDGSKSYYRSIATTYLTIEEAPQATATSLVQAQIDYTLPIVGTGIATVLAIAIVGIVLFKKRT